MFNGISDSGVDPFYPAAFGTVTNPDDAIENIDYCMAHLETTGILHYHVASTCVADHATWGQELGYTKYDILTSIKTAY